MVDSTGERLRLGAWARGGGIIGLVAHVDDSGVTLFSPGDRQMVTLAAAAVERVPSAALTITATVDLPIAHGVEERAVRRWMASLLDDHLRDRARSALSEAGIDEGAALPVVRLDVQPAAAGAVCLCGAQVRAPERGTVACAWCGREAVSPPTDGGTEGGDGRTPA